MFRMALAVLVLSACSVQAQDRLTTLTCIWDKTGATALEVVVKGWRDLDRITYFKGDTPKDAIEVLEFYDGGVVKAVYARYSPATTYRLEVFRDANREGRVFIGQMWPIGSSASFPVTCESLTTTE